MNKCPFEKYGCTVVSSSNSIIVAKHSRNCLYRPSDVCKNFVYGCSETGYHECELFCTKCDEPLTQCSHLCYCDGSGSGHFKYNHQSIFRERLAEHLPELLIMFDDIVNELNNQDRLGYYRNF